ncbi:uncharacterized protein LOC119981420 [Tripterygium wilfordii]|uniref:uncharacterized protein LOC119981420 n=1 Tax=Tripterygium wilfordii TaxID=458696 RepID=UPI0018F847B8|nr:uncharacterized protein LOC119981420 [Tripterygium wilfordii]
MQMLDSGHSQGAGRGTSTNRGHIRKYRPRIFNDSATPPSSIPPPASTVPPPASTLPTPLSSSSSTTSQNIFHPTQSPPINQTHATSSSHAQVSETPISRKRLIEPDGEGFHPHKLAISGISEIIQSKFDMLYPSWKKIPPEVRKMWFREFEASYCFMISFVVFLYCC